MNKKVAFYTLGCKLNFSETSTIAREFEQGGFMRAQKGEQSDICVINTCSVTADADKKCRNVVRKAIKDNPSAIVAVTGCYAQLMPEKVASIQGVDLVIGNNEKGSLVGQVMNFGGSQVVNHCEASELSNFFAAFSSGDRTRAFLKVQDGCSYHCSYCTIPLARGASRNISIAELTDQATQIASKGQREIVLTGVNIGDFGRTTGETFAELIASLDRVEGIDRYRISSIEPNLLTDEVIEFCSRSNKFQPHFHVPLQAGTDKILAAMRRRYTTAKFAERIAAVRAHIPEAFIGIDVIVGFPGETDEDFEQTYNFLEGINPAFLHIFPYSERANTPAIEITGKVSPEQKHQRVHRLEQLSSRLHAAFHKQYIGTEALILVESSRRDGKMFGYTENYIKVEMMYNKALINMIISAKLSSIAESGNIQI